MFEALEAELVDTAHAEARGPRSFPQILSGTVRFPLRPSDSPRSPQIPPDSFRSFGFFLSQALTRRIYRGETCESVRCCACGGVSQTRAAFDDVHVAIQKESEGVGGTQKESEGVGSTQKEAEGVASTRKEVEGSRRTPEESEGVGSTQKEAEGVASTRKEVEGSRRTPEEAARGGGEHAPITTLEAALVALMAEEVGCSRARTRARPKIPLRFPEDVPSRQVLEGENAYHCAACAGRRRAVVGVRFTRLPSVLRLGLKVLCMLIVSNWQPSCLLIAS